MIVVIILLIGAVILLAVPAIHQESCSEAMLNPEAVVSGVPLVDFFIMLAGWLFGPGVLVERVCSVEVGWSWYLILLLLLFIGCKQLAKCIDHW